MTPKIHDPADTPSLIAAAARESGTVLIVGYGNTVPVIIELPGGQRPAPLVHKDFGDIWHIAGTTHATRHSKYRAKSPVPTAALKGLGHASSFAVQDPRPDRPLAALGSHTNHCIVPANTILC